jgi:hypothetical protein
MRESLFCLVGLLASLLPPAYGQVPVLKRSDVVFMYQANRQTYADYGATVLAWGGTPRAKSLEEAEGLTFFGSVGMVTEFSRYYERFPDTYEQGLCRNLEGKPFKVPWLTDHQHKGVPYWWCCTRQPVFRQYISERVVETVKAGANGVHIDDHLGTAGALWLEACFCDRCVAEFPAYLKSLSRAELERQGIPDPAGFDYRKVLRAWVAEKEGRKATGHPLWRQWRVYQLKGAAGFMHELRALAARTAGRPVPMSANACLLWGPHLNDYKALDFISAEIEHHAPAKAFSDDPILAYRLADAVGRPLASTASGGDWAFVKEHSLPGLVQGWMALGYAAGNCLMAPQRQWCYTPEKGTHWYEGPKEKFAPLCQFVRRNAELFDDYRNHADVVVAFSQRTFDRDAARVVRACNRLAAANVSYRVALGGDEVVDRRISREELTGAKRVLILDPDDFSAEDKATLAGLEKELRCESIEAALGAVSPAVRAEAGKSVRVFPRIKPGSAVIHLLNWGYEAGRDGVEPLKQIRLTLDLAALGVAGAAEAGRYAPGNEPARLALEGNTLTIPEAGLWTVLRIQAK